jgi:hypothetical protein
MRSRTQILFSLTLLVGAGAFAPSVASAQAACPAPILVNCREPAYLATACGQASTANETSACTVLLRNAYQAELQKPDVTVEEVMTPDQPGTTSVAGVKKYQFSMHMAKGFPGEFLGIEQQSQLLNVSGGAINIFADGATLLGVSKLRDQRAAWQANGNAVQSCVEYTNERFDGYSKWKDLADVSLLSDEALYDSAFDPVQGIANRTLYSKSGAKALAPVVWPSNGVIGTMIINGKPTDIIDGKSPKNGYFKAFKSLAKGTFFGPNDTALRAKLQSGSSHHFVNWNWHKQQHDLLAPSYDAETLRYFEDKQADFLNLVAEREALLTLIARHGPTLVTSDPPTNRNLAAELTGLEAAIRSALTQAQAEGCIDAVNPTKCDWSYRQMRDQVVAFYSKQMEASFQLCRTNTGDNFKADSPVRNAVATFQGFANGRNDYTTNAEGIETYGDVVKNWVAAQTYPKKPDGTPFIGDRKSDSGTIGSGSLSLDWSYNAGWDIKDQAGGPLTSNSAGCSANLSVDGAFTATGHAFGTDVEIIDAKAKLFTEGSTGKAAVHVKVLGDVIWDRFGDNGPASAPYTTELATSLVKEAKSGTSKSFSKTVFPFGIPLTLSGGVGMSVGLKLEAKAKVGGNCQSSTPIATLDLASVQGIITPWAQADAFGEVAIGIPGFRAGVKCEVVIVRGEMPITATGKIAMSQSRFINASMSLSGKQKFRMLDGSVKAFLDGPFDFMDTETTIFSWQGPSIEQELFRFEKTSMPIDLMKQGLAPATPPPPSG